MSTLKDWGVVMQPGRAPHTPPSQTTDRHHEKHRHTSNEGRQMKDPTVNLPIKRVCAKDHSKKQTPIPLKRNRMFSHTGYRLCKAARWIDLSFPGRCGYELGSMFLSQCQRRLDICSLLSNAAWRLNCSFLLNV